MRSAVLIGLVALALIAFSLGMAGMPAVPAVWRHLLFAVGMLPLILAAMLYFVPVLTRTSVAPVAMYGLPATSAGIGLALVVALYRWPAWIPWLAAAMLLLVGLQAGWIWRRRKLALAGAHPGLYWYLAALTALLLGISAVLLRELIPAQWQALRVFHLHMNLYGFLGLTAIGTLRVLLPTVLAIYDRGATLYLRQRLALAVMATLCISLGAAAWSPLSWLGAVIAVWLAVPLLVVVQCGQLRDLGLHHAALALSAAGWGWMLVLLAGLAHGLGYLAADPLLWLLVFLFLLPLVTGASSYLLPLWRWPGQLTPAHARMRARLMRYSGVRVLAFYASAGLLLLDVSGAHTPALIALLSYIAQLGHAFLSVQRNAAADSVTRP